jgi:hypothetical protein
MGSKPQEHSFEIIVAPLPRKTKSMFWTREPSEQKWIIKSESEDKMVDWIVDLKNKINSYIPDKPPSPLFKSMTTLEADIESRMLTDKRESINSESGLEDNAVKLMAYPVKSEDTLNIDNKA